MLLNRFKEKETITGLQKKMSEAIQGNQSVSNFVAYLEQMSSKQRLIQLAEMGQGAGDYVKLAANQVMLSALKSGLNGDARIAVLAANPSQFDKAVEIALSAEVSGKERSETGGVYHTCHFTGGNYSSFRGHNNRRGQFYNIRGQYNSNRGHFPNIRGQSNNNEG